MALVECPECGKQISDHGFTCPHCGYERRVIEAHVLVKVIIGFGFVGAALYVWWTYYI